MGQPPVGFINPAIYAIGKGPNYASDFHDITTGNNTSGQQPQPISLPFPATTSAPAGARRTGKT